MAFEELLFPSMFTGKKKYCGVVYTPGKMEVKSKLIMKDIMMKIITTEKNSNQLVYQNLERKIIHRQMSTRRNLNKLI